LDNSARQTPGQTNLPEHRGRRYVGLKPVGGPSFRRIMIS
jgi:hypothetical protein